MRLSESSTCFDQLCAHLQEDSCMNTTFGIITLKTSEWSKITKITRIHRGCNAATMYSSYLFGVFRTASTHCISRPFAQLLARCLACQPPLILEIVIYVFVTVSILKFTLHVSDGARHFILGRVIYKVCTAPLALQATAVECFGLWWQLTEVDISKGK
jgi:hypothetical protein